MIASTAGHLTFIGGRLRRLSVADAAAGLLLPLALGTLILLAAFAMQSLQPYSLNFNEGWNAYWADRVAHGDVLYPSSDAMVVNNYPPLSFLLIGWLSHSGVDPWILGRGMAWVGFAGCLVMIRAIMRAAGVGEVAAGLGAATFAATMALHFHDYLGMYDPQLLAHSIMLSGLWVLLRSNPVDPTPRAVMMAAIIIVLGGFFKHNLVALPIAMTLWLALFHRDLLAAWLSAACISLLLGFLTCWLAFGANFFTGLMSPRVWNIAFVYPKLAAWLPPLLPMIAVSVLLLTRVRQDPIASLFGLYVIVALAVGCAGLAGDGVVYSALFELAIATALAVGYVIGRPACHSRSTYVALAAVGLLTWSTVLSATSLALQLNAWSGSQRQQTDEARRIVAIISKQTGPVLCEDLLLCYWAGRPFALDPFNYLQAVRLGRRDAQPLLDRIAHQEFAAIELSQVDHRLIPSMQATIQRHYAPIPVLPALLLPRLADHTAMAGP